MDSSDRKPFDFRLENDQFSAPGAGTTPLTLSSLQKPGKHSIDIHISVAKLIHFLGISLEVIVIKFIYISL